ncbi:uncharacterized protein LOC132065369 [Lycium ferocissimum]|uniref:uncharacterized protein LOC132065369 n=1 Tax=Lycium ferocissimum TaxID=112874 RepID=UPI0028150B6D|nr:uncharacterized protein LOC132065369 [Lycium ferocissimum]
MHGRPRLRQFGRKQHISGPCVEIDPFHYKRDKWYAIKEEDEQNFMRTDSLWVDRRRRLILTEYQTKQLEALSEYFHWYRRHSHTFIGNPAHNVDRGYQHMAGRHEALALGHQESYRLAHETIQDPTVSNEMKELAEKFSHINTESMAAASLGTMLSFAPNYTPPSEYVEPPTVHVPRRQRPNVPRPTARGRGCQAGNRRGRSPVDHQLVNEDDVRFDQDMPSSSMPAVDYAYYPGILQCVQRHNWLQPPSTHHRFCVRHLKSNFTKKFLNTDLEQLMWLAATEHQKKKYKMRMEQIKILSPPAHLWLNNLPEEKWTLIKDNDID